MHASVVEANAQLHVHSTNSGDDTSLAIRGSSAPDSRDASKSCISRSWKMLRSSPPCKLPAWRGLLGQPSNIWQIYTPSQPPIRTHSHAKPVRCPGNTQPKANTAPNTPTKPPSRGGRSHAQTQACPSPPWKPAQWGAACPEAWGADGETEHRFSSALLRPLHPQSRHCELSRARLWCTIAGLRRVCSL